jgi:hypothetical protein
VFTSWIGARLADSASLKAAFEYISTSEGTAIFEQLKTLHQEKFPEYYEELQGLAEGAGVPFDKVHMLSIISTAVWLVIVLHKVVDIWILNLAPFMGNNVILYARERHGANTHAGMQNNAYNDMVF